MMYFMVIQNLLRGLGQRRLINLIGFTACTLMLGYAFYLQYYQGLMPCPLCVFERFALAILGLVFLVAAVHDPRPRGAQRYGTVIMLVAGISIAIAGYHVWLQNLPSEQAAFCLPPLSYMLRSFPLTETIQMILYSPGDCGAVSWRMLGLSIPAWTLLACIGLGVMGTLRNWARD